ncbi:MAG: hypothetical protein Q8K70_00060 [Bacteroidota bacterium]|nr:hypothetical protein [Bacteroidota bacterium]
MLKIKSFKKYTLLVVIISLLISCKEKFYVYKYHKKYSVRDGILYEIYLNKKKIIVNNSSWLYCSGSITNINNILYISYDTTPYNNNNFYELKYDSLARYENVLVDFKKINNEIELFINSDKTKIKKDTILSIKNTEIDNIKIIVKYRLRTYTLFRGDLDSNIISIPYNNPNANLKTIQINGENIRFYKYYKKIPHGDMFIDSIKTYRFIKDSIFLYPQNRTFYLERKIRKRMPK